MQLRLDWRVIGFGFCLALLGCEDAGDSNGGADVGVQDQGGGTADIGHDVTDTPDALLDVVDTAGTVDTAVPAECFLEPGAEDPEWVDKVLCQNDFLAVASEPIDASIPGAMSCKTILDRLDDNRFYFQNSKKYLIHWEFAHKHLSGNGKPLVPALGQFNQTEYYSPARRFILGALTYYQEPGVWVYEISPYDTASFDMIQLAYETIQANAFFGDELFFHPTSAAIELEAKKLPASVKQISTDELFKGITYQPLNLAEGVGRLRFMKAKQLETEYLNFRDIVVLDSVPNDIAVVAGIITGQLQTPLSHINVLSQNRGTPNMALIGAETNEELLALDGKWVRLVVGPFQYTIEEVTLEEADAWWEDNKPKPVGIPNLDMTVTDLRDTDKILDIEGLGLGPALKKAIPAFGGKASHYGALTQIGPDVPVPQAYAIPVYYYRKHMENNGLDKVLDTMLEDEEFKSDPAVRFEKLAELQEMIRNSPVDPDFEALLMAKLATDFPGQRMRFRSSTNAEDLDGFTGAGLYTSLSGDPNDPKDPIMDAVRGVWASIWKYKAFEERSYRSIDHKSVGMALLSHPAFPEEDSNGVALTANIFDTSGLEPGFYINAQIKGVSVVLPDAGVTTDQMIYHYQMPGQPIVFLSHSNLIPPGQTVLTAGQTYELGKALSAIHQYFFKLYGPPPGNPLEFYAMDVEWKFDSSDGGPSKVVIKQARPHPGWGLNSSTSE